MKYPRYRCSRCGSRTWSTAPVDRNLAPHGASTVGALEKLLNRVDDIEEELQKYQDHNEYQKTQI